MHGSWITTDVLREHYAGALHRAGRGGIPGPTPHITRAVAWRDVRDSVVAYSIAHDVSAGLVPNPAEVAMFRRLTEHAERHARRHYDGKNKPRHSR